MRSHTAGHIGGSGVSRQLDSDRGQLPDARHWPGKATMEETTLHSAIFAEPRPRSESIPAGFAGEQTRFTGCGIYSSCVASRQPTSRRPRGQGPFVRRRPNCPRLMSSVFRYRFFPPTKGFAAACFIHEATWCSSRSSTDASSTPRVDLPIPIGVTGGSGLISVPRMNISFT
jgi:hypothetical protein